MSDALALWYDNLHRELLHSGAAQQMIEQQRVIGFSTNVALLERAIGEGSAYDNAICETVTTEAHTIFDHMMIEDVQRAADLLRPAFDRARDGASGFVSLDVSPLAATSPEGLLEALRRLARLIGRPNVMLKVPGKPTNLTVIEEALFSGVNLHITGVYSEKSYTGVAEGYIRALERRLYANLPVDAVASVVSFSLDTVDSVVEGYLRSSIRAAQSRGDLGRVSDLGGLVGKAAIANAHMGYRRFRDLFDGERFARLRQAGAHPQRLLWADTEPSNPSYPLTRYLDSLRLPDTLALINQTTLAALGVLRHMPIHENSYEAEALEKLHEVGIDLEMVARQLQSDSEESYADAFKRLIARVDGKRKLLTSGFMRRQSLVLGQYQGPVEAELKRLRAQKSITRTWLRDATLWKDSPEHVRIISNRLGWLTIASDGRIDREMLAALRDESRAIGWGHVVLLGMGGSTLTAQVLWKVFGPQPGYPALISVDSTDPATIWQVEQAIDLEKTVFVVASKTGTTLETNSLVEYFFTKYKGDAGEHFIAITDAGSPLDRLASERKFRRVFHNPPDIVGRYSALSYFGMVPAALLGLDFERIMDRGTEMQLASGSNVMGNNHPGLWLGTVMGVLARRGLDKVTVLTSPEIAAFGDWAEQLIAESTGKDDKGLIPIAGATVGMPHDYDDDRLFIYLRLDDSPNNPDDAVRMLQEAGHPVVTLELRDVYDIGAEFFRWQFGTAVAGMILGINPFDEPNVLESKANTARLLDMYRRDGRLPEMHPVVTEDGVSLYADERTAALLQTLRTQRAYNGSELVGLVAAFLGLARSGDYIGVMSYLQARPDVSEHLENLRRRMRHTFKRAVTIGYGPRFLHSTGQLHKGGPDKGLFIQLTADDDPYLLPIPGSPYSFSIVKQAQAAGDIEALQARGRRIIRLHLGRDIHAGLQKVLDAVEASAEKRK